MDDSVGERAWVEHPLCRDFVLNIQTVFATKPVPFSVDNSASLTGFSSGGSSNDLQSLTQTELSTQSSQFDQISISLTENKKSNVMPRYTAVRNEIEVLVVDIIRNHISNKSQANQRNNSQASSISGSSSSVVDSRNFLKLLQSTCGFGEVRAIATSRLEGWLSNPKVISLKTRPEILKVLILFRSRWRRALRTC